jgi:hypothetical protein
VVKRLSARGAFPLASDFGTRSTNDVIPTLIPLRPRGKLFPSRNSRATGSDCPCDEERDYDSDGLRQRLLNRGTELIAPYLRTRKHRRFEDNRKLRRYRRRWKVERTNAWLQNFRRIQVRYDLILSAYQGFFHCDCLIITLRHLCN